jgi:sporulation protein YlmC with PRC-barrel domain
MQTWSQKAFIPFRYVKSVAEEVIVDVSEAPKNMSLPETYDCILGGEGSILSFRGIKGLYGGEVAAPQVWKVAFTGCLGAPIMSMDRKKLLGTIYDYVIDIMTCKRIGLIFEERKIFGPKKKFFIPMNKIMRQKEKVFTYFLINLEDAKPL